MSKEKTIREQVASDYTRAAKRQPPAVGGGSGCGCGSPAPEPKGTVARVAGYEENELASLPEDAVVNSFGCGNPLAYSEVQPGDTVLDLGSGAGIDVLLAARKVGPGGRAIGVDMTEEMLSRARENIARSGLTNAEVRQGIIEELPVKSASVDWVISNCVINLSPEKERVFAEIHRVLRPGGRFLISDIVIEELPPRLRENRALYSSCVAGAISEKKYLEGLRAAGLQDVEVVERLIYDESQITSFLASEEITLDGETDGEGANGCCGALPTDQVHALTAEVAGKIWSAKFRGRRAVS